MMDSLPKKRRVEKRYDLPLHRGSGGALLVWTIGVMSYLTVLMLVLVFGLSSAENYWQNGLTGHLTVEIPYSKDKPVSVASQVRLVDRLNALPGITVRLLTLDDIGALVGPWLGTGAALAELPLPTLIDVTRHDAPDTATPERITDAVHDIVPEAMLDTHAVWLADLIRLGQACRMILVMIALILGLTAALTVAATAKTRLALHRDEVDLLHMIGATDAYIARQFQRQAFRLASEGAGGGLVMALITLAVVGFVKQRLGDVMLPHLHLSVIEWLALAMTPLVAGTIAMIASRHAVLRALKQIP